MSTSKIVRIVNTSGTSYDTHVFDVETGEEIKEIYSVEIGKITASSGPIQARITLLGANIDLEANAQIDHCCPHCKGRLS